MSLGKNIKRLRLAAGLSTQRAVAELLGVPQPQVCDWENDRYAILEVATLLKLAKALHCSVDQLLAGVDPEYDRACKGGVIGDCPAGRRHDIPVVAEGDAPPAGPAWNEHGNERTMVVGWLSRPGDLHDPNAYAVRIRCGSMLPAYRPNMIAIVSPSRKVRDRDEVYVQLASGESLVRLVRTVQGGWMLQPYDPVHTARFVRRNEVKAMHVIVYSSRGRELPRPRKGT